MSPHPALQYLVVPFAVVLGFSLAGCSGLPQPDESEQTKPEAADQVQLEVIDETGFAKVLEQNRGRVVLVDCWATWCPPCKELFPHTVGLHEQFGDQGLTVISVALDDSEDEATALAFLTQKKATFDNFISKYGSGGKSYQIFAIPDGALPHLKLYDRDGRLHKTFASGQETIEPEQIDRAVEELLRETSPEK